MDDEQKELIYKILGLLAAGAVVASAVVAPGILIALSPFVAKKTRSEERRVYRALRYTQRQQWVRIAETNGGIRAEVTTKGRRRWQQLSFNRPLTGNRWDGVWRVVIFDIPNKRKSARDTLRGVLKRLGFYQLQESVWVVPWPCRDHVQALREFFLLPRHIKIIEATSIEQEDELLAYFNLKK